MLERRTIVTSTDRLKLSMLNRAPLSAMDAADIQRTRELVPDFRYLQTMWDTSFTCRNMLSMFERGNVEG